MLTTQRFTCISSRCVKPVEAVLRPKGQGLGADRRPGDELDRKRPRKLKPGDKRVEEEPQGFAKGVGVLVISGAHKNLYGKVRMEAASLCL